MLTADTLAGRLHPSQPVADRAADAAVLIALIERTDGLHAVLTRRADHLRHHPGQVAFPGGRLEAGETVWDAALREAHEEIGLDPGAVTRLGYLDAQRTTTGFEVVPCVGAVTGEPELTPAPAEVAHVFTVPLMILLDRRRYERHYMAEAGRDMLVLRHAGQTLWGATAGMVANLIAMVEAS